MLLVTVKALAKFKKVNISSTLLLVFTANILSEKLMFGINYHEGSGSVGTIIVLL